MTMQKPPKKWKMMLLTWLCIYPTLNILLYFVAEPIAPYHPLVRTLILTLVLVPVLGIELNFMQKIFKNWLAK